MSIDLATVDELSRKLDNVDYLADQGLATALFCAARLPQPLLLEGEAGVGKTEAAKALAAALDTPLVRLQCYEGLTRPKHCTSGTTHVNFWESAPRRRQANHSTAMTCSRRST